MSTKFGFLRLSETDRKKLEDVKQLTKIKKNTGALRYLLQNFQESLISGFPIATFDNIANVEPRTRAPAAIVGIPGSGKSTTLDMILHECAEKQIPFLLLNCSSEHAWIRRKLAFAQAISLTWLKKPCEYRVQFAPELETRRVEMKQVAESLLRIEGDARLRNWVIGVEESHDFCRVENFRELLRRFRKSVRRMIIVSTEAELFGMCELYRPIPH